MNVKQLWPKIVALIFMLIFIVVSILGVVVSGEVHGSDVIFYSIILFLYGLLYWIPTFVYSSPVVFLINWLCGGLCCIGWVVALIFAIKGRAIPTMSVGVPTDYSQNQVNNYWNNSNNQQTWGTQNSASQQTQWDNSPQSNQNNGNDYWNSNGNQGW